MFGAEQRDIDQIAEYADSGIRQMVRTGSLAPIAGRGGLNKWLYDRWGNRGNALYTALGSLLTIALSGLLAWALDEPLVFPRSARPPSCSSRRRWPRWRASAIR